MARTKGKTKQLYAEVTPEQLDALNHAIKRKYGNGLGMRAQFIRDAVAEAVRAQGVEWVDGIEAKGEWKTGEN